MVEIPDDVAKAIADDLRRITAPSNDAARLSRKAWAALLDPKPPTLREQVAKAWCAEIYGEYSGSAKNPSPDHLDAADAVLAVVADWLAAQPLPPVGGNYRPAYVDQRDHDVRLLRGGSDG